MLSYLAEFSDLFGPLRLFGFVTFRAGGAALTAMVLGFLFGPYTIRTLRRLDANAPSRLKGLVPDEHLDARKDRTPSMGGVLILFCIVVSTLLWGAPGNPLLPAFLITLVTLGLVGFMDDYTKIAHGRRDGISARMKMACQMAIATAAVAYLFAFSSDDLNMWEFMVPFRKLPLLVGATGAAVSLVVGVLAVIGASNAVNLTDGKDGLAVGCSIFSALAYATFAYVCGHRVFAGHLQVPFIPACGEVTVFAAAIIGACIAFLWFNCHPAAMFMGDTGSLALGGSIGLIAVLVKQELTLVLVGGVFVIEAASVILQVASFRLAGKRIFLCTPIHHHFERKGWTETQIVVRFWILAGIFALMALATLKIR